MQTQKRSFVERRTGKDRRRFSSLKRIIFKQEERRVSPERRSTDERRHDWVRVTRWSSAFLNDLKISKYILGKVRLTQNNPY